MSQARPHESAGGPNILAAESNSRYPILIHVRESRVLKLGTYAVGCVKI